MSTSKQRKAAGEFFVEQWNTPRENSYVPNYMIEGVHNYLAFGDRPGSFLMAVLSNDLLGAFQQADENNRQSMLGWAMMLECCIPMHCRGSKQAVDKWLKDEVDADEASV